MSEIQPSDIEIAEHFWGAFDHSETEVSAKYIVRLCQERGGWLPFTYDQINELYQRIRNDPHDNYTFNRLVQAQWVRSRPWAEAELKGGGWIFQDYAGVYHISADFIKRCFNSSPAKKEDK